MNFLNLIIHSSFPLSLLETSVSYFFNDSLSQAAGRRAKQNLSAASPLLGGYHINHQEEYDIPESASCVAVALPLKKRFIDLWPIQMASIATGSSTYKYSFDTYTMVLQLGCTLHMQDYWKENYCLRVIAFVEDFEDAKDEEERVKTLLKGLRIEAEVKMVWLRSADGSVKSDSEEYEAHMVSAKKQQRGQYLKENMVSSSSSAAASSSSTFARFELPPMSPPLNASVPSVPRKMRRNTLSMMTTTRLPSSFLRRVESATPISPIHSPHGSPITSDDEEDGFLSPATSSLSARSPPLHLSTSPSSAYLSPPLIMYGALSTGNTALSSVLEERVTINMNSAAAGTSTSSSYSFASSSPSSPLPYSPSPVPPPFVPPPSLFNSLDTSSQHLILNQLMRKHSSSFTTALIFSTLPAPDPGTGLSREKSNVYVEQLDILSHDLQPIILVHGKGLTVTMSL